MSGMLSIHTKQNGTLFLKMISIVLALVVFLCGCTHECVEWFFGDGRGDWELELINRYSIVKINSCDVILGKKHDDDSGWSIVLGYYVTSYQIYQEYIYTEGIVKRGSSITDEELENPIIYYYIVNTLTDEIFGPFETYSDFLEQCDLLSIKDNDTWLQFNAKSSEPTTVHKEKPTDQSHESEGEPDKTEDTSVIAPD